MTHSSVTMRDPFDDGREVDIDVGMVPKLSNGCGGSVSRLSSAVKAGPPSSGTSSRLPANLGFSSISTRTCVTSHLRHSMLPRSSRAPWWPDQAGRTCRTNGCGAYSEVQRGELVVVYIPSSWREQLAEWLASLEPDELKKWGGVAR